jgi:P-type Cu+ transporter
MNEGVRYTCPMHSDVDEEKMGSCPKCGMALEAKTIAAGAEEENAESKDMRRRLWVSAILTGLVFLLAMTHMIPGLVTGNFISEDISRWIQFIFATPVVLWGGWPFFVRGARSIRTMQLNMFTLISMGVGTAFFYSAVAMLFLGIFPASFGHQGRIGIYFEAAAIIVVLVLVGQVLELRARSRTGAAIRALLDLTPATAHIIKNNEEAEIGLEEVEKGDKLRVRPGEKVPVDGVIIEGRTTIDESMITGESMPVEKSGTDTVMGGTINNTGSFVMRAERVGSETVLAQIVEMVAQAQRSRAPIQSIADKVAGWFVPAVVFAAVITFIIWAWIGPEPRFAYAIVNAVAVLIIACPCALGLATPMSIMVGVGRGAGAGVLTKNAEAIEMIEKVTMLVVDKTGTLTEGKPKLIKCAATPGFNEEDIISFAASVEQNSEHPLAGAIVKGAKERNIKFQNVTDFESVTGGGVVGKIGGKRIIAGKPEFLREQGIADSGSLEKQAEQMQAEGQTLIFVGIDNRAAGVLAAADPIKESTKEAIQELHRAGLKILMMTGDNKATAESVARKLGIDMIEAGVEPKDKNERVSKLREAGEIVAMAGDGINDAPALAAADVGIAMGSGTDVAMESAGITLVKGDLRGIVKAVKLGRAMMRNIRQNLFFAFIYNALGIPIAGGVLYPFFGVLLSPIIAGAAMSFSSVSVISNALRLRKLKI